jgi:hypothetical protein
MRVEDEIKSVDKEVARLARKKEELLRRQQLEAAKEEQLNGVLVASGYETPVALVDAFIRRFGLRVTGENTLRRKRKRTTVTAELCDAIRQDCSGGLSMNRASKKHGISYAVVTKILNGVYDGRQ